jgi:hypothetical protein
MSWQQFHDYYFGVHNGTHTAPEPPLDAGMVADDVCVRVSRAEWAELAPIQLGSLRAVPLYANQTVQVREDMLSGGIKVDIRYAVPCITTMGAA